MDLLYSNILPLPTTEEQETISDCFINQLKSSERIDICVGYVSDNSLKELEQLIDDNNISNVTLTIGMYFIEGMPEKAYHTAMRINEKWQSSGIGEIRIVKAFKYHGKLYCFSKNNTPVSAIIGSANLSFLKPDANNRRQYEISELITDSTELIKIEKHIKEVNSQKCSDNIASVKDMKLIAEENTALENVELVKKLPPSNVDYYKHVQAEFYFNLALKVPKHDERHIDDNKHYTKSNINVCYAAPRSKRKSRDWFETQITVGAEIYKSDGYPEKHVPFFIVTDDGYWFKAHTTSDNNKQFSAVGDELIMGRWLKGRLAAAGLVTPVNDTQLDKDRTGMITQEILKKYGRDHLLFKKTGQTALDEEGNALDVWLLSFEVSDNKNGDE